MAEKGKTGFEKFAFPIILVVIAGLFGVLGVLVDRYILSKSPELSYYITQSQPIDTGTGKYYSTTFNVLNTGNVPLENVILNVSFDDTIETVNIQPSLTKNGKVISSTLPEADSTSIVITFDLAKKEQTAITVVSVGTLRQDTFRLKSDEVLGKKMEIGKDRPPPFWVITMLVVLIALSLIMMITSFQRLFVLEYRIKSFEKVIEMQEKTIDEQINRINELVPKLGLEKKHIKTEIDNNKENLT